jgi:hypothetical protein
MSTPDMTETYKASCHCGRIQIEVTAELSDVFDCNCSICARSGFLHWYVAPEQVKLLTQKVQLSTYMWRFATCGQHFCPTCGVAVIRTSTQFPPPVSINARCLEGVDIATLTIREFDGKTLIP